MTNLLLFTNVVAQQTHVANTIAQQTDTAPEARLVMYGIFGGVLILFVIYIATHEYIKERLNVFTYNKNRRELKKQADKEKKGNWLS